MNDRHGSQGGRGFRPQSQRTQPPSESGRVSPVDPPPEAGGTAETDAEVLQGVEQLQADNADLKDRLLRALAEVENMRRRSERDVADASKYAISKFAKDMIAVADNMDRAMVSIPDSEKQKIPGATAVLHGIELTAKAMRDALARNGIEKLDPVGHRFDPNFHEAMFEIVDPSKPNGTVADVLEPGYAIGSRPLRPAKVAVTRDKPPQ